MTPAAIYRLFTFLNEYVQHTEDSPTPDPHSGTPVVIRFVTADATSEPFPAGTEGFAGLTGFAKWQCVGGGAGHDTRRCQLWDDEIAAGDASRVVLAVIRVQTDPGMTAGYLTHELSHVLGAIDGPRCPASEDYNPMAKREPDFQDAYWWYGVTGFFDLKPCGIVWQALKDGCVQSDRPALCIELGDILADLEA